MRPRGPERPERCPPRLPEEMSLVDVRERVRDSPLRARSLLTVRAAISQFIARTQPQELMITSQIFEHSARLHSYKITAEIFG